MKGIQFKYPSNSSGGAGWLAYGWLACQLAGLAGEAGMQQPKVILFESIPDWAKIIIRHGAAGAQGILAKDGLALVISDMGCSLNGYPIIDGTIPADVAKDLVESGKLFELLVKPGGVV